jgi:hypothetical protein
LERLGLVYCTKCGAKNEENDKYCTKCGAPQEITQKKGWEEQVEEWGEGFGRRVEKECFGLPHGGAIFGLIFGIFILALGLGLLFNLNINFGGYFIVVVGLLILVSAVYSFLRRR